MSYSGDAQLSWRLIKLYQGAVVSISAKQATYLRNLFEFLEKPRD